MQARAGATLSGGAEGPKLRVRRKGLALDSMPFRPRVLRDVSKVEFRPSAWGQEKSDFMSCGADRRPGVHSGKAVAGGGRPRGAAQFAFAADALLGLPSPT